MKKTTSNIGMVGINSIRIGGMKISDLPIAEQASAAAQIPISIDTERQNNIENIIKRNPSQRVSYLQSRINECRVNIERMKALKVGKAKAANDYRATISMCDFRDRQIALVADNDPNRDKIIKKFYLDTPPYKIDKMNEQIAVFEKEVVMADEVTQNENDSIAEMTGLKAICEERDRVLKSLGVRIEAG